MNVLHVLCAVFLVGPMAILPMTAMRSLRAGDGAQVAGSARSVFVFSLLSLLTVIFGFGVLGASDPKYGLSIATTWVWLSLLLYAVALAINLAIVVPALRTQGAALKRSGEMASGGYQKVAASSGIAAVLLVVVVILMVWKP